MRCYTPSPLPPTRPLQRHEIVGLLLWVGVFLAPWLIIGSIAVGILFAIGTLP